MKLTSVTADLQAKVFFDLDGVICVDPPVNFHVGTLDYETFLLTAEPLGLIRGHVDGIVTGRTEKYRSVTLKWLQRYGILFDEIHFKPEHLAGVDKTPAYKAQIYKKSDAGLFVESSKWQAEKIAAISHKPVFSIEDCKMYAVYQRI